MSRRQKPLRLLPCVYCRGPGGEGDHIPAQALFRPPLSSDLITVPACKRCNGLASLDDEFFVEMLVTNSPGSEEAERVHRKLYPSPLLVEPRRESLSRVIASQLHDAEIRTPAGLVLGTAIVMRPDMTRVKRVLGRIVEGLFFHEFNRPLATAARVAVEFPMSPAAREKLNIRQAGPLRSRGNVFEWGVSRTAENPDCTTWVMRFFGQHEALGLTGTSATFRANDTAARYSEWVAAQPA